MYKIITLDNGLRVVIEKIDYVNSISVGLWVKNGSRRESKVQNGISHFIEHMLFKGTKNRSAKVIAESIEEVGGQINAFTSKEVTCFYIKALDSYLELSLDVLSDMLLNSTFDEKDIEKEKSVILDEINLSEDTPEEVLQDLHSEAVWGEDGLALPILGTPNTVSNFTSRELKEYLQSVYVPDNSILSISGKVDVEHTEELVNRYFGAWRGKIKEGYLYSSPEINRIHMLKNKEIEQVHLSFGIPGLKAGDKDMYTLLLLNNYFGGGASSLLFQSLREDKGLCYSVYSYASAFINTGLVTIYAAVSPQLLEEATKNIQYELENFVVKSISEERLIKVKEQLKSHYILGLESTGSRMFSNGKSLLFLDKIQTPKQVLNKIDNIQMQDIIRVMNNTFGVGIYNSAMVGKDLSEGEEGVMGGDMYAYKNIKSKRV